MAPKRKQNARSTKSRKQQPDKPKPTARLQPAVNRAKVIKPKKATTAKSAKNVRKGPAPKKQQISAAKAEPTFDGPSAILGRRESTPEVVADDYVTMKMQELRELLKGRKMKCSRGKQDCIDRLRADDAVRAASGKQVSDAEDGNEPLPKEAFLAATKTAERILSKQDKIHNIGRDNASFVQYDTIQDEESLYRAFAFALLDNRDRWESIRFHTREWWNLVTANGNRDTPESQQRLQWYRAMNEESLNGAFAQELDDYHHHNNNNPDPMSPTLLRRNDCSNLTATIMAHKKVKVGADLHILLVLADAFDVKLMVQEPQFRADGTFEKWITHVRGRGGAKPVYLARYPTIGHWTALTQEWEGYHYLDAVQQEELHKYRCPLTRSEKWYPQISGTVPPYITNRSVDVPTESLMAKEAAKGAKAKAPKAKKNVPTELSLGPVDRRARQVSEVSEMSSLSEMERRLGVFVHVP